MGLIKRAMPEAEDKLDPNEQPEGTPVDAKEDVAEGEPLDSGDAGEQGGAGGPEYDKFLAAAKVLLFKKGGLAEDIGAQLIDADDPVAVLADQVYNLVAALDERSGGMLPDELLAPAAADVLEILASRKASEFDFSADNASFKRSQAVEQLRSQAAAYRDRAGAWGRDGTAGAGAYAIEVYV